jgi:hypothetical protein
MITLKNSAIKPIISFFILFGIYACGQSPAKEEKNPRPPISEKKLEPIIQEKVALPVTDETRKTYQWYCAQCHGVKGKGDGINSPHVTVPPRNHTKAVYLETRSDQDLFDAISQGGLKIGRAPCMPSWGSTFDEKIIWSLVRYIRELCKCESI